MAGRSAATAAAADVAARDLDFCIELAAPRSTELADALRHGTLVEMGEAIDDVSEHYGQELGLSDEQVGDGRGGTKPIRRSTRGCAPNGEVVMGVGSDHKKRGEQVGDEGSEDVCMQLND